MTDVQMAVSRLGTDQVLAHITGPKHLIADAAVNGWPMRTLCGLDLVPLRDPSKFPLCAECKALFARGFGKEATDADANA